LAIDDDGSVRATWRERRRPRYAPRALPPANSTGRADISVRSLRIGVTLFRSKLAVTIEAMTLLSAGTGLWPGTSNYPAPRLTMSQQRMSARSRPQRLSKILSEIWRES